MYLDILHCWIHGFGTKTGAEPWLIKKYKKEDNEMLVQKAISTPLDRRRIDETDKAIALARLKQIIAKNAVRSIIDKKVIK
jgi:hypothetical protein